ncbi:MAG: FAD:protein FMN transferase [Flavobacteriaceae bacterium]
MNSNSRPRSGYLLTGIDRQFVRLLIGVVKCDSKVVFVRKTFIFLLFGLGVFICSFGQSDSRVTVQRTLEIMGAKYEFTLVVPNEEIGYINIEEAASEIKRVEKMISSWIPESETSLINENAGISPVKVSDELFKLIDRCIKISEITDGAFDISYGPLTELWRFDGSMQYLPTPEEIRRCVDRVGYDRIYLNTLERTVFLKKPGMKLNFGGVGKGYSVDRAKELLISKGVLAGMINASGDITTWGTKSTGEKWLIGIENPGWRKNIFTWIPIVESSVSITANYKKYVMMNGKRYSHIINPKTGYPVTGIDKVAVLSKTSELCDALATAVVILGKENGLALIDQLGGTEVIIADNLGEIEHSTGILLDQ